ncbi:MAG: site-specific DNA-methyltransferase [Bacteroidetes bacterium]|nr:MAG: site-specific DNA-methyltransferase [Bacteroidota bacterium]
MEGTSLTPQQEKLKALQELLPEAFAEGKIDWEKLKATLGEDINFSNERYVLNWAGKSDAFKVLQTPSTKTLVPAKDESINFDTTENIFIEGENLEVLKVLQKSYFGKVKMIYIDPPYNTGNDSFIYPDKFSETKAEYEKRVGDKDEEGYMTKDSIFHPSFVGDGGGFKKNSKENGQYHSNWLNMMMPRLYLAKNLLTQDGVIFVSIDDNEVHNLRLLMNEIFGEENFISEIAWRKSDNQANIGQIARVKEYILCFTKSKEILNLNKIPLTDKAKKEYSYKDDKGNFRRGILLHKTRGRHYYNVTTKNGNILNGPWMIKEKEFRELDNENKILWTSSGDEQPYGKIYLHESNGQIASDFWDTSFGSNQEASLALEKLFDQRVFDFPKSTKLLKNLITIGSQEESLILDFFAGSGTTAHAVMELNKEDGGNRKYICVQLPEFCDEKSEAYKAGYKTIADISKERIRRASKTIVNGQLLMVNEKQAQLKKLLDENSLIKDQEKIDTLQTEINQLQLTINNYDSGFKVLKLAESNFKQWQQIEGKDAKALTEQMQLFIDPVAENATIENMVYEFLLKSGKDLNSKIEKFPSNGGVSEGRGGYFVINNSELVLLLESVSQTIIEQIIGEKPMKVIALDKLFTNNDQLKTNTVLQMRDAGIEFKTV